MKVSILVVLAACVSAPRQAPGPVYGTIPPDKVWARVDGQVMARNPALLAQGKADLAACNARAATDEPNRFNLTEMNACMSSRGYMLVEKPS